MYEYKCAMCGKHLVAKNSVSANKFCGKKCYGKHLRMTAEERNKLQNDPKLPPLREINDEGYTKLVSAMVEQARSDVLTYSPGTCFRKSAEEFFASDYFTALTGTDGFEILCKLQDEYDKKMREKEARKAHDIY